MVGNNPGIIIQARLNGTRFPHKITKKINDNQMLLEYVKAECDKTGLPVVIASPITEQVRLRSFGFDTFGGSENDVISRFYHCAKKYEFDPIIRVCADSKMIKADLILQQLENYNKYNHFCYGNFCEIFSFKQLEHYYFNDKRPQTREHVTLGMIEDMTVNYEIDLNEDINTY